MKVAVSWKETYKSIQQDIYCHGGKNIFKKIEVYLFNPSFRILLNYRLGRFFYHSNSIVLRQLSKRYSYRLITKRGCDISYRAAIGKNVKFAHPLGIVIGDDVIVKDDVRIWQFVTIGSHGKKGEIVKYPIIGKGVKIFAGAKIIGGINVGDGAMIGANSVVNIDIPMNKKAVGIPSRIID